MFNARLYGFWGSLTDALKSGRPQNEARQGESFFGALYSDPQRLQGFLAAMSGVSMGAARAIAAGFPWRDYESFVDVGCAQGALADGDALLVYEAMIGDERRANAFGLLMSLNMLIETPAGFDFTGAQCCTWMKAAGFRNTRVEHLIGPDSMVIGIK